MLQLHTNEVEGGGDEGVPGVFDFVPGGSLIGVINNAVKTARCRLKNLTGCIYQSYIKKRCALADNTSTFILIIV